MALLDVDDFWAPLVAQLDRRVSTGLLKQANRDLIKRANTSVEAFAVLESTQPGYVEKWITSDDR